MSTSVWTWQFKTVYLSAGPSWQICTTSARRTESASGEWRKQKTCRILSRTESPTYRYLHTLSLCVSHLSHAHEVIYTHIPLRVFMQMLRHTYKQAYVFWRTSFTLSCLICIICICRYQFPRGAGDCCDSRLFQQSDVTSRILFACRCFGDTHTHAPKHTDTHADLQK